MGIDYYRCKKCDVQVDDCIGGYDSCESCDAVICYDCTWKLKIRGKPVDCETPGKRLKKYEWDFTERGITVKNAEEWDYCLMSCPYCKKLDKAKEDAKLLKFLLKKAGLTRSKAVKEMNGG